MIDLALAFATSVLLGMRHAADPDHLVAVGAIVGRGGGAAEARRVGVLWGLGHTLTVVAAGSAIVGLKLAFTPRLGLSLELVVALMLILLGILNLRAARHPPAAPPTVRPFVVGVVHGLAGSAGAALLLVPLFGKPGLALLFLLMFGAGTVGGMTLATTLMAVPAARAARRIGGLERGIRLASGAVCLAFGVWLALRIGLVDGLFSAHPRWDPS